LPHIFLPLSRAFFLAFGIYWLT